MLVPLVLAAPGVVASVEVRDARTCAAFRAAFASLRSHDDMVADVAYRVTDRGEGYAPSRWVVHRDGAFLLDASSVGGAIDVVLTDLDDLVIARNLEKALVLHASAVERDGRVVLLPGSSGSGKTTLCAALLARGAAYVTDEAVVVSQLGAVVAPYPRPLCIKSSGRRVLHDLTGLTASEDGTWHVDPTEIGQVSHGGRTAAVVLPRYDPHAGGAEMSQITRGSALLAVAQNASFLSQQGPRMLPHLAGVVVDAACAELVFADARAAADTIMDVML